MSTECKVRYQSGAQTFVAGPVDGKYATCTAGEQRAAEVLGRKVFGADFAHAELCGRADQGVFYRLVSKSQMSPPKSCAAGKDGDCNHRGCPQTRDGEPHATGRHCPVDREA